MTKETLHLYVPTLDELWYRQKMMQDPNTMHYNRGYCLDFDGYDSQTGCIAFPEEQWRDWHAWFIGQEPARYYAYIVRDTDGAFIGEVNLHQSKEQPWHEMGIVLEAQYRGKGYAADALSLLLRHGFESMRISAIHNSFEPERAAACKAHLAAGFTANQSKNGQIDFSISSEQYFRQKAIRRMADAIANVLRDGSPSIYLYGSCVLDDFRLGWSDIDLLVLTQKQITPAQALKLVTLRQALLEKEPENPYYRSFEGGMLPLSSFLSKEPDRVVYWGTSGQRITDFYTFDNFSMTELLQNGQLLYGQDIRSQLTPPTYAALCHDVKKHYECIRQYAQVTDGSFYSFGWLLDIARGIYTLRNKTIAAKTEAAQWALDHRLCPVPNALKAALTVRKNPLAYRDNADVFRYAESLGPEIQLFANVLEQELHAVQT